MLGQPAAATSWPFIPVPPCRKCQSPAFVKPIMLGGVESAVHYWTCANCALVWSTRDRERRSPTSDSPRAASVAPEPVLRPDWCPYCHSTAVWTRAKMITPSTYWYCQACGQSWAGGMAGRRI